jgi:hypothetical protein
MNLQRLRRAGPSRVNRRLVAMVMLVPFLVAVVSVTFAKDPAALGAPVARAAWQEPVIGLRARILSDYRAPAYRWVSGHRGVDVGVEAGELILSPTSGSVYFAGRVVNRGVISIIDEHGLIASFEPVCPLLSTGLWVRAGDPVAVQCEGDESYGQHCPSACIHFSARLDGGYLSPLHLIYGLKPSRLWPVPQV